MKKTFESGRIWTFLSAFIFMMMCGLVVLAVNTLPSSEPGTRFNHYKTNELEQENGVAKLTTGAWNDLMDGLNHMLSGAIPEGAIIAFDSRSDCPDGWNRYSNGKVPGGDMIKIWCKKGEVEPKIRIDLKTIVFFNDTAMGYSETLFSAFGYPTRVGVEPGVSVEKGYNYVKIGDEKYELYDFMVPEHTINNVKYEFRGISTTYSDGCKTAIPTSNCSFYAEYREAR